MSDGFHLNKMHKRGLPLNFPTMQANIMDVAGVRVICSFEEDVFFLAKCLKDQSDIEIITGKDYISHPKPNDYLYLEKNGQMSFIKPSNYEVRKTKRFKEQVGRIENMTYDEQRDAFICTYGKRSRSAERLRNWCRDGQ